MLSNVVVEDLKEEVEDLKSRCAMLERTINQLVSRCDTHERCLEGYRQHLVKIKVLEGTLDTSYLGENFDFMG
jgi:hypothetical protein